MATEWRALITYQRPETTDESLTALVAALPGYGIVTCDETTMRAAMTVEATTIKQATETALRTARTAHTEAFGRAAEPTQIRVLTADDYDQEIAHPAGQDLVGVHEAAEILAVTKQRVGQLAADRPDFPAPLVTLRSGPVWTKASVEAFAKGWERRPGRPRKTADA